MKLRRQIVLSPLLAMASNALAATESATTQPAVVQLKNDIVRLAQSYAGQGDPDFSKQASFQPLIDSLLALRPQAPVSQRIATIAGPWQQIWGPYNYRGSERTVDPELGVNEIYQVVLPNGIYYNVTPLYDRGDRSRERIALLRGEYRFDDTQSNVLLVRFVRYPGLSKRPADGTQLFELPGLLERGEITSDINVVPTWIVRILFGGGALKEVYTDAGLRILYGASSNKFDKPALYIMNRVTQA